MNIKRIIAREGLIIVALLLVSGLCLVLNFQQEKRFVNDGKAMLQDIDIEKYNLFMPQEEKKSLKFDASTAMPEDTTLSRDDYIVLAKQTLLENNGFSNIDWHFYSFDNLEKRFGVTNREKVDRYYKERDIVEKEMRNWGETHLAAMAGISLEHFERAVKKINHLKQTINFSGVALFFAFIAYPLYLLIQFILWAIRTLKQKD